ncbi:trypsin-like peptidase domain-containing protein [uncultured Thiohalocapsa sp.]|uniref:S1C family serine protease n=1 Tax=uncultured Thiohalocapsa sp. TaxID=768990 RepID=UPI0025F7B929|nr:trypsin-like peptidase domain-containing protein [uncultured Thiohalocapsa sp.]
MTHRLKMLAVAAAGFSAGAMAVVAILVVTRPGGSTAQPAPLSTPTTISYADAVALAAPAVLRVFGQRYANPGAAPSAQTGAAPGLSRGSAVLLSGDGLLVTSGHLVAGTDAIGVQMPDRRILDAQLLGIDAPTDLAVLRIHEVPGPAITVGDPAALRPGDVVLAIGNPFGLDQTVSFGIVSALGRSALGLTQIEDFIQTDAAINPGNSGGALIDARGRLVGINTAIMSDSGYSEGVAFAIPADRVLRVVAAITDAGGAAHSWIGIGAHTLDAGLARRFGVRAPRGVFVSRVFPNSPAAAAGLRPGDVIVAAAGEPVITSSALREAVIGAGTGGMLRLSVWRGSEQLTAEVHTGPRPASQGREAGAGAARGCRDGGGAGC